MKQMELGLEMVERIVKSVNGINPDATGDITVTEVENARKLGDQDITFFAEKSHFNALHGTVNEVIRLTENAMNKAKMAQDAANAAQTIADSAVKSVNHLMPDVDGDVQVEEVENTQKLGNQPASYYATKTDADAAKAAAETAKTAAEAAQITANGAQESVNIVQSGLNDKVDKVVGKQLSANDYTDAEKTKLADIDEGANRYVLPIEQTTGASKMTVMSQKAVTDAVNMVFETPIVLGTVNYGKTLPANAGAGRLFFLLDQ